VKLGVAFDLSKVIGKINRDWLFHWIKIPKEYFPETLMPRFRYSDGELRALVEYILRDDSFNYIEEETEEKAGPEDTPVVDTALIEEGKRVIELSRCVVCHDIKGIEDILPVDRIRVSPSGEFTELLDDVKCLACHGIQGKGGDYAPDLTQVGSKLKMEWIEKFLQTPDMIRPLSQQMPKFNLTENEAKMAARYIKENFVRKELVMDVLIDDARAKDKIDHGRSLFYQKGCLSCHQIDSEGGALSPGLSDIRDRLEPEYIFFHLKGPHRANPYAVEPDYGLTDEEALALTYFLLALEKADIK
jgi:mono/diheme cytochrome c family protein